MVSEIVAYKRDTHALPPPRHSFEEMLARDPTHTAVGLASTGTLCRTQPELRDTGIVWPNRLVAPCIHPAQHRRPCAFGEDEKFRLFVLLKCRYCEITHHSPECLPIFVSEESML